MALRETAHQCNIFVLSQSRFVYVGPIGLLPQFSFFLFRYVSFLFHMPYAFLMFASIVYVYWVGFTTGFVLARSQFLLGHLLTTLLFSGLVLDGTVVGLFLIWGAFFIVWFGSDLDWRGQRVTAKFSSSELSSHQKARPSFSRTRFPS